MSWIEDIVNQHKEFESPLNFWRWAALTAISAVVKDNVWINQKSFNTFPNIYVMFHADSGLKKGPPVNMAKKLVNLVGNNRVISGRSSIQGIMKKMSTSKSEPGKEILKTACAFLCFSELSSALVEDAAAMDILTDLYDRSYNSDEYESLLKQEQFDLKAPIITMLSATNESHSNEFFTQKDIGGGFFARTFVIYEHEENRINSLMGSEIIQIDYVELSKYLVTLSKLHGPFQPFSNSEQIDEYQIPIADPYTKVVSYYTPVGAIYEKWYYQFRAETKGIKDPTGTLNRFGTSVLKVSMLLSLGMKPELKIQPEALEQAIELCEKLVGNIRQVTIGRGSKSDTNNGTRKIIFIKELLGREVHRITRAQLHKKYWLQGTIAEWDETILSAEASGMITIEKIGDQIVYTMPDDQYNELNEFLMGKNKKL